MTNFTPDVRVALASLTLNEKVQLLSGEDAWSTYAIDRIGLRKMTLSDGPSGVRGPIWDERAKALTLPSATCVAATWNTDRLYEIGRISAQEASSKGVSVVLGPTINLHRSPLGGRHFEAYSEDPLLSGVLATAYIRGVQDSGVAATLKHFIANDSENERMSVDVQVDPQALNELYLAPFETAILHAQPWAIMASYNKINGTTATEHPLLRDPLRESWGFDGVSMSDWTAVRSVEASANAALDLAMPGPSTPWAEELVEAVLAGKVPESAIDEKVGNLLTLAKRVGAFGEDNKKPVEPVNSRALIREIAAEGFVLVKNNDVLPLKPNQTIAVIGSHSIEGRIGGGGSSTTIPHHPVSPISGLLSNAPEGTQITSHVGFHAVDELTDLPLDQIESPSGTAAIELHWIDAEGNTLLVEDRFAGRYIRMSEPVSDLAKKVIGRTKFVAKTTGLHRFGISGFGQKKLTINGKVVLDAFTQYEDQDILEALAAAPEKYVDLQLLEGEACNLEYQYVKEFPFDFFAIAFQFGYRPPRLSPEVDLQAAVEAAKVADVAVVVIGTTAHVESEGYDRTSMRLPGRQDELVREVAAVNPNTVVVVNAGSPVEMPWRNSVAAVLLTWFPGEEYGNALADVLYGRSEPGGRLPTTWGATLEGTPITDTNPKDGVLVYEEGLNIGYRAWAKANLEPAYHFGYGLGYTTFEIEDVGVNRTPTGVTVSCLVKNTGKRDGSDVVQVYLRKTDSSVTRPELWLAGFAKVHVAEGHDLRLQIELDEKRFAHWDDGWKLEKGTYEVLVSRSADLSNALKDSVNI